MRGSPTVKRIGLAVFLLIVCLTAVSIQQKRMFSASQAMPAANAGSGTNLQAVPVQPKVDTIVKEDIVFDEEEPPSAKLPAPVADKAPAAATVAAVVETIKVAQPLDLEPEPVKISVVRDSAADNLKELLALKTLAKPKKVEVGELPVIEGVNPDIIREILESGQEIPPLSFEYDPSPEAKATRFEEKVKEMLAEGSSEPAAKLKAQLYEQELVQRYSRALHSRKRAITRMRQDTKLTKDQIERAARLEMMEIKRQASEKQAELDREMREAADLEREERRKEQKEEEEKLREMQSQQRAELEKIRTEQILKQAKEAEERKTQEKEEKKAEALEREQRAEQEKEEKRKMLDDFQAMKQQLLEDNQRLAREERLAEEREARERRLKLEQGLKPVGLAALAAANAAAAGAEAAE